MNIAEYLKKKEALTQSQPQYRTLCFKCCQTQSSCFCHQIKTFESDIEFVILIHPIEVKRKIATGRMAHLSLKKSYLIEGQDYTLNPKVNELLADQAYQSLILYPGPVSQNLSLMSTETKNEFFKSEKKLRIFVIDGTWATARKMIRQSENLKSLPRICFTPMKKSNFRVRKQPRQECLSTIEAIHHTIDLLNEVDRFKTQSREHDSLLETFNYMVEKQIEFIQEANKNPKKSTYRREAQKKIA